MTEEDTKVTICIVTLMRAEKLVRLVQSIRRIYPSIRILVGEQLEQDSPSALQGVDADIYRMPIDFGVSATRNALVKKVNTPYFLICDDDFVFLENTRIAPARLLLEHELNVGIVGGLLYDRIVREQAIEIRPRLWESFIYLDNSRRSLFLLPANLNVLPVHRASEIEYFLVDCVLNFALMRTALFRDGKLRWDPQFLIEGEHEDFYLSAKSNAPEIGIAYCPRMAALHDRTPQAHEGDFHAFRSRMNGWRLFSAKWNIDHVMDLTAGAGKHIDAPLGQSSDISVRPWMPVTASRMASYFSLKSSFPRYTNSSSKLLFDESTNQPHAISAGIQSSHLRKSHKKTFSSRLGRLLVAILLLVFFPKRTVRQIVASGLFDVDWYSRTYRVPPSVDLSVRHFLLFGELRNLSPGPHFDCSAYLENNPDVAAASINPLLHYLRYGRSEGRPIYATNEP